MSGYDVCFAPGEPARAGRIVLWRTDDGHTFDQTADVVLAVADDLRRRTVPARWMDVTDAIPLLLRAYDDESATPSAAWWGAATAVALDLIGRGRLVPRLTSGDVDEWRVGPLEAGDVHRLEQLIAATPATAQALSDDARRLPGTRRLLRAYIDACADALPRCGTVRDDTAQVYVATPLVSRPELRAWVDELAGELRLVLRVESEASDFSELHVAPYFHRSDEPTRLVDAARIWNGEHRLGSRAQLDAVLAIRSAARVWAPLGRLLELSVPDRIQLSDDEISALVGDAGSSLVAAGIDLRWPRELVTDVGSAARIGERTQRSTASSTLGSDAFELRWQIAIGERTLSEQEVNSLAEASRPVVRLRDQWVVVSDDVLARARDKAAMSVGRLEAVGAALTGRYATRDRSADVVVSPELARLRDRLAAGEQGAEPLEQPPDLRATLRDYQLRGLRWLDRMASLGLGCCLADDMGLGKTITVIALHLQRATGGPTLVVCPATLLGNWEREIANFAPGVAVRRFHGSRRSLDDVRDGFVLTTYGTMRRDAERLGDIEWTLVIADEAQHIKNHRSATARELRRIESGTRIALTGTPVENDLQELWAILDWAVPGLLGTAAEFQSRYAEPIQDADRQTTARLKRLVAPFLLRRRKTDPGIAPELSAKTETDQPVALTDEQIGLYEAAVREGLREVSAEESAFDRAGRIFAMLTALKQIGNHPAQYLREENPRLDGRSGKLALLDELLDTIGSEGGSTLVFTQYVAMARLLRRHLEARGTTVSLLDGSTPVEQRQPMVDAFQRGEVPVFLLSLRAAGTGLNLTRADHVVHYDRWWNPAVEDQATDRAYRIGQTRAVQVHRLIAEGTIEDRIAAMLCSKRELADTVLTSGEAALSELSDTELEELVGLRSTP